MKLLYQRMGEVRDNASLGLWFRGLAGKNTYDKNRRTTKQILRNPVGCDHLLKEREERGLAGWPAQKEG